jgi:hypothetical protein
MDNTRRQILKIHGIALIILGVANALISSVGAFWGTGPFGFLQVQRIGHVLHWDFFAVVAPGFEIVRASACGARLARAGTTL